jgi:nucleoside-diphosphate-sugar epimerase
MKILLTGSVGFTGRFFHEAAAKAGHAICALGVDLTDKVAVAAQIAKIQPDAVVHLAAISFVEHADDSAFYSVNVVGTTNLLSALVDIKTPIKKVLIASSANIYGNCEISPIGEDQYAAPMNHYATSKLAMECMSRTYMERLPIVMTRPFNYTGPGQAPHFLIPKLVSHFASRAESIELGNLHVEREFNDVRMVCDAYLSLLNYGEPSEVYNVCSGNPFTLSYVLDTLTKITGHHLKVNVNPAFVRANEVHRLCGDPTKLNHLMMKHQSSAPNYALSDTLKWMLAEAVN